MSWQTFTIDVFTGKLSKIAERSDDDLATELRLIGSGWGLPNWKIILQTDDLVVFLNEIREPYFYFYQRR
ncbi:MAG TPA: hypothetical protein VIV09_14625 [Pseudolabrys sp.]